MAIVRIFNNAPSNGGTVTSVGLTSGTGISVSGGAITSSGTIEVTNSAPDQTVVLNSGTGINVSGTYPNFTIANSAPSSGGTVTNVSALTIGTTGTDLSSTIATGTTTPVITLNVPTASATNRGVLSSANWTTFNTKGCSMGGNLNGTTITVTTTYLGIGATSSNTTETNRRTSVIGGTVTYLYLRTAGTMTGTMVVTLMKNGVATTMTFTIATSSAANVYSTTANQVSVADADELSLRVVQTTATSIGVQAFGFIIK
jgi:hypothetical protein